MSPRLRLLGTIRLERSDGTFAGAEDVPTSKALDLLRLLAAAGKQARSVDHYIHELWPAADEAKGRMSLRTAVAHLRRAVDPEVVRRSGDQLSLGTVETDIDQLRRGAASVDGARRSGDDADVVRIVRTMEDVCGADLVVSGSSCAAVYAARDELRELRCRVLLDGAAAAARLGWARDSLDLAQRADQLSSSETSCRAVMTGWATLGETGRAIETFERLQSQLDENYGVQPSPATRALYLQVLASGTEPALRPAEHHRALAADLSRTLVRMATHRRRGGVVWVHGEPGSGRGEVARHALRLATDLSPLVAATVDVLPELVGIEDREAWSVRREASESRRVLVVPVRRPLASRLSPHEVHVVVPRLTRPQLHDLLRQLLQEEPAAALEERLWTITAGLAGHTRRTVSEFVRDGRLRWTPGSVDLVAATPVAGAARPSSRTALQALESLGLQRGSAS